jgi:outer membrane receptor for monomeric catechols
VNSRDQYIYSFGTPEEAYQRYVGVEFLVKKRLSRNWQLFASYTWSRAKGTVYRYADGVYAAASPTLDNKRQQKYEEGYLGYDSTHRIKLMASYKLPYDVTLGVNYRFYTGYPYERFYFNDYWAGYWDRRAARSIDPETGELLRLPDINMLNLRAMWNIKRFVKHDIDLIVDIFNVFHLRTPTAVEQRNLPEGAEAQWGDVLDKLDPFRVQLGMRYRY